MVDLPGKDDDHDDLGGALDFSGPTVDEEPTSDAWNDYAPPAPAEDGDTGADLDTLHSLTEAEEEHELDEYTVSNPSKSVSVTALMDGRIHQVVLTDKVERMSESQLAEEIFVLADLARQKARAGQYTFMLESLSGDDKATESLRELVGLTLNLPTPEEAEAAQEEVFATRYFSDRHGDDD